MSLLSHFRVVLAIGALALPCHAQVKAFGSTAERMAATRLFFTEKLELKGMVCAQYGQPQWKDEYDQKLESLKGKQLRLGKDFWTTLNTSVALDFGGTVVPAGSYYLGLKCDAEGNFSLLVLRAEAADKAGWGPFAPNAWKPDFTVAMKRTATDTSVDKLRIDLDSDEKEPTHLTLSVSWGKHKLSVATKSQVSG